MVRCFFLTRRNDGRRRTENGIIVPINDEGNETIRFLTFVETEVQLKSRVGIVSNENSVELDLIDTTGLSNLHQQPCDVDVHERFYCCSRSVVAKG